MFYLLLCGYPLTECRTQHTLGPYYTAQACVYWETQLNKGIIKNGPNGPLYTCVNENGEIAHANVEGCYFGRSAVLGDDGTGDGKAGGVICPAPSVVHGHPDLLDGPPEPTQPTMHFGPRTCFDAEYHQKPCTETSPEGNGDLGP